MSDHDIVTLNYDISTTSHIHITHETPTLICGSRWFQIAKGVSKMKKTGTNISTRPKIAVICISCAFGLLMFICFAIIRQTAVGSGTC